MSQLRIGIQIEPNDSFWVQVQEVIFQKAEQLGDAELIPIEISDPLTAKPLDEKSGLLGEFLTRDLDALICKDILPNQLPGLLDQGLPTVYLAETSFQHPLFTSPQGLYDAAYTVGQYLVQRLGEKGYILCAGGLVTQDADDGSNRLTGLRDAISKHPQISFEHIPTPWDYDGAKRQVQDGMRQLSRPIDAIFGLSDTIALAACEAGQAAGVVDHQTLIAGINGDPFALAAIAEGSMTLTVETPASEMGDKAIELAILAARGEKLPTHFSYQSYLVTAENVNTVALQKLIAIADMPSRLVGVNRRQEQNHLTQLETSVEISRRVGALLDRQRLLNEISALVCSSYGYDDAQVLLCSEDEQFLIRVSPEHRVGKLDRIPLESAGVLGEVVSTKSAVFISDTHKSSRFTPDPDWPETHSRVALPIQLGDTLLGVFDLHSRHPTPHLRHELVGLQSLANQMGIAIRNAELYAEALKARTRAEKADQLKTRLLANVSHELRTPLNVIMGYAQTALSSQDTYGRELPPQLDQDLKHIFQSSEHLLRLINDLLDLSRAEIDALELWPETIHTKSFLGNVFHNLADTVDTKKVIWRLDLPSHLPLLEVDPLRVRQILINLLHNSSKFTEEGQIVLGAEVTPPYLHIWVQDTGMGIPIEVQERIFEPFITHKHRKHHQASIGLGLTISHRLVALHGGSMSLESQPGQGSTFHIYLPLPDASGQPVILPQTASEPILLLISAADQPSPAIRDLCKRQGLTIYTLDPNEDLKAIMERFSPAGLAWDIRTAGPSEWKLFEQVRAYSQLCRVPLIIYGQVPDEATLPEVTNVLMKPVSDKTLLSTLNALSPRDEQRPVFIVDDDPEALALYQRLVSEALPGYPIQTAEDGAVALTLLEEEIPCLVILDLMMPDVDGFTVLEQIRAKTETRHVPVIILSGRLLTAEDVRRLDYGRVIFFSKDMLKQEEAIQALQRALSDQSPLSQPTSALVKQALAYLHQNYEKKISRQEIANAVGVSKAYLNRIFKEELNLSPIACIQRFRIQRAKELLINTNDTITSIAAQVGYDDSAYFTRVFRKLEKLSPHKYRQQTTE